MAQNIPIKFLDWIDEGKINWTELSCNPSAIYILERNLDKVSWSNLCFNPNAVHLIEANMDKLQDDEYSPFWNYLCMNENAISLLKRHPDKITKWDLSFNENPEAIRMIEEDNDNIIWYPLLCNPAAIHLVEPRLNEILPSNGGAGWKMLCQNPAAIHILEKPENSEHLCMYYLASNPNAIGLIKKHIDELVNEDGDDDFVNNVLSNFCRNEGEGVIELLEKYPEKIRWNGLSRNKNAIHLLERNQEKISWYEISRNTAIFQYDYDTMKHNHMDLKEEIIKAAMHPSRILRYLDMGGSLDSI